MQSCWLKGTLSVVFLNYDLSTDTPLDVTQEISEKVKHNEILNFRQHLVLFLFTVIRILIYSKLPYNDTIQIMTYKIEILHHEL